MRNEADVAFEEQLVDGTLWHLSPESTDRWGACRSRYRFLAYTGKQLVIYRMFLGKQQPVKVLTCKDASLDLVKGLSSQWQDLESGEIFTFSCRPTEVMPSIFVWHTFLSDIRYQAYKGVYSVRFSMLYLQRHNPKFLSENTLYIQERAGFEASGGGL